MNYEPRTPWQFLADDKNVDGIPPAPLDYEARGASRPVSRGPGAALAQIGLAIFFPALGIMTGFYLAVGIASGVGAAGPGPDHYTYNDYARDGVLIVAISILCLVAIIMFIVIVGGEWDFDRSCFPASWDLLRASPCRCSFSVRASRSRRAECCEEADFMDRHGAD